MTPRDLLLEAEQRGLTLMARGEFLAVTPARLLTADFADVLRAHKLELLAILEHSTGTTQASELVKPKRPLTDRERALLVRFCGNENDPVIITALNLFHGRIVG